MTMKSEQEIQKKIDRLEQLKEKHDQSGDYTSKLDVSNSIRLLKWVLDEYEDPVISVTDDPYTGL